MTHVLAAHHEDHHLGDIGRLISHPLDRLGHPLQADAVGHRRRLATHAIEESGEHIAIPLIDGTIRIDHPLGDLHVTEN